MSNPTLQPPTIPHNPSDESQTSTIIAPPLPLSLSQPSTQPLPTHETQDQDQIDLKQPLPPPLSSDHKINTEPSPRSSVEREKVEVKGRALEPVMEGPKYNLRILLMSGQSKTFSFPPHTSVGVVKELVWGEWPGDWNPDPGRPPAPTYFRILFMGRMLADPEILSGLNLKAAPASTIVHLSLRTFPPPPEEPPKKSILPFSLPTLPRPSGLSSRQNSSNVQTTVAPGSGTGGSAFVPSSARANDPGAQASTTTTTGGGGGNGQSAAAGTGGSARPVTYNGGEEHGGGCKCVIQ